MPIPKRAMPLPMPRLINPKRLVSTLTVRARIVAIALIPVVGFLANGIALRVGESTRWRTPSAASSGRRAGRCQPGVQGARSHGHVTPRHGLRGARRSSSYLVKAFEDAQASATAQPRSPSGTSASAADARPISTPSSARVAPAASTISRRSRKEQETARLHRDRDGIRAKLRDAASAVERDHQRGHVVAVRQTTAQTSWSSLLPMRRYEAEYGSTRSFDDHAGSSTSSEISTRSSTPSSRPTVMKSRICRDRCKTYTDTFDEWIASDRQDRALASRSSIRHRSRCRRRRRQSSAARTQQRGRRGRARGRRRRRPRSIIIGVGIARRAARAGFSWLIGRSITRPLDGLAARHEAARRRRHLGEDPGDHAPRTRSAPWRAP